jgi:hypothetical protein
VPSASSLARTTFLRRSRAIALAALPVLLGFAASTHATDYHVSPEGRDANAGSRARPWRTIERANRRKLGPGDRLLLQAGATFSGTLVLTTEDAGTPSRPVVVGSYGAGRATIDAGTGAGVLVANAGGVVVENLVLRGDGRPRNTSSGLAVVHDRPGGKRLAFIRIRDVEASGFGRAGIFVAGLATNGSQGGFEDVRIERCDAHDNVYYGILVGGPWDDDRTDTVVPGKQDAGLRPGYTNRDVYVGHCRAYRNLGDPDYKRNHSGSGILVADTDGALIEHCLAWENGALDSGTEGGPCGIWAAGSNRVTIQYCESFLNRTGPDTADGNGFDFDGGMTNSVMQYNYSHHNDGFGYLVYEYAGSPHAHRDNVVRYNVSAFDGRKRQGSAGIFVDSSGDGIEGVVLHNNTVIATPSSAGVERPAIEVRGNVTRVRVLDNLLAAVVGTFLVEKADPARDVLLQGNAYWAEGRPVRLRWDGQEYTSLEAWRSAAGQELLDGRPVGLSVDPALPALEGSVTLSDGSRVVSLLELRPRFGSPLTGAGVPLPPDAAPYDLFGIVVVPQRPGVGAALPAPAR